MSELFFLCATAAAGVDSNVRKVGYVRWSRTHHTVAHRGVKCLGPLVRHASGFERRPYLDLHAPGRNHVASQMVLRKTHHTRKQRPFPRNQLPCSTVSCCKCRPALTMSINSGGCGIRRHASKPHTPVSQRKRDSLFNGTTREGAPGEAEQRRMSGGQADTSSLASM